MTDERRRWRSEAVPLKLLGTAGSLMALGLGGCSMQSTWQRNVYTTPGDCIADYSDTLCKTSWQSVAGSRIYGPVYRMVGSQAVACSSSDPGPGRSTLDATRGVYKANRVAIDTVPRGGFGTTCPSSSSSSNWSSSRSSSRSWWGRGG